MQKRFIISLLAAGAILFTSCTQSSEKGSFGYDLDFLSSHREVVVLQSESGLCQLAVIPDYQGRVMTSTAGGLNGKSYGWINYDLIASGKFEEHINVFGGEDRFWLGPEGGQYSIFFEKGTAFTLENWYTPKPIDTEPFELVESSERSAMFYKEMELTNYAGFRFNIGVEREVSIFDRSEIESNLDLTLGQAVQFVGYQSENILKNTGQKVWSKKSGLLSIWMLGMFNPSDRTTVIIPYRDSLMLNTSYFGAIGPDRLKTTEDAVFFKGDGKFRSKIGIPPANALPVLGSYDPENNLLTIVEYTYEGESTYVNSMWEYQDHPYAGDVVNSYNDGPLANGSQLGPFYELESSSGARELAPGEEIRHIHKTYHFEGEPADLDAIARKVLGIGLGGIEISLFAGNWALEMPDGAAGWLTLSVDEEKCTGQLWTVGMPNHLIDIQLKEDTLRFKRKRAVGDPEYPGGAPTGPKIEVQCSATVEGDSIFLVMERPLPDGSFEMLSFGGKRLSPLPPRPDLSKVKFGEPITLFNGQNLDGWRLTNPHQENGWKAVDGILVNETPKKSFDPFARYGNLRTDREFEDFKLILEFKVPEGGNSGIYLRGRYEVQVLDRDSRMQGIQGVGALFARIKPSENAGKPGGVWQQYDITLVDRHLTVILNGKKVIDNQPVVGMTKGALKAEDAIPGPIYLQGDHTSVSYRNIILRPVLKE